MIIRTQHLCLALAIAATLTACNEIDTSEDPRQYVAYSLDKVIYPNDILLTDSDGTLELNQEVSGEDVDYRNYENVYGALDGWSTGYPIVLPLSGPEDELDSSSLTEKTYILNVATGELLRPNEDYVVGVTESGDIQVMPTSILPESTTFIVALSDGITDVSGNALRRSNYYQSLLDGDNLGHARGDDAVSQIQNNHSELAAAGVQDTIVYSARFTTQSVYPVMEAAKKKIPEQALTNITFVSDSAFMGYSTYKATIKIPYYLEMPNAANCDVPSLHNPDSSQYKAIAAEPVKYCESLYSWWKDGSGSFVHGANPEPMAQTEQEIPVMIYAPVGWSPESYQSALPAIMYVHGITGWKELASTMVKSVVNTGTNGRLVVAIDHPLHGERGVDLDENGSIDITASAIEPNEDKSTYLNLLSPLTLRDNQRQAVIDQLTLRKALNNTLFIDNSDISLVGHSLGAIVSTMVSELSQQDEQLAFTTVSLVAPGMHLTDLVMNSATLGDEVSTEIKNSTDIQLAIAGMVGVYDPNVDTKVEGLEALAEYEKENSEQVEELESMLYASVSKEMFPAVQAAVDAGDPANFTAMQSGNTEQATLLIEVSGTCDPELEGDCDIGVDYLPDAVIPNQVTGLPAAGTEPLIDHLMLSTLSSDVDGSQDVAVKGVIRVKHGGHGSYLFPYEGPAKETEDGKLLPSAIGDPEFTAEEQERVKASKNQLQETIATFIDTKGKVIDFDAEFYHTESQTSPESE
ncbi:hypothetical protein [Photobacterium rosenbergii]|uniref:hypothetical protein n=1 Tax=Photobacterium rosenbergii TaxID=294936 RepID=UPI001C9A25D7|nr:hypothetical protein [Photobacterium rosenbergii]MBY5944053.1 hypothetical protein [Photobacterium rosenbergii]